MGGGPGGARLTLVLSPARNEGFSGAGSLLLDLVDPEARRLAAHGTDGVVVGDALAVLGPAARVGSDEARSAAMSVLCADGRVGYDLARRQWYTRQLPFAGWDAAALHPRLRDARVLVDKGAVVVADAQEGATRVGSGVATYDVTVAGASWSCTCRWGTDQPRRRGPCKHVLAAQIRLCRGGEARG